MARNFSRSGGLHQARETFFAHRCCQECYDDGKFLEDKGRPRVLKELEKRDQDDRKAQLVDALGVFRAVRLVDASTGMDDVVFEVDPRQITDKVLISALSERIEAAVKHPFDGDGMSHSAAFRELLNGEGNGLFDIFLYAFAPKSGQLDKWSTVRTSVLLSQALHMVEHGYSSTQ